MKIFDKVDLIDRSPSPNPFCNTKQRRKYVNHNLIQSKIHYHALSCSGIDACQLGVHLEKIETNLYPYILYIYRCIHTYMYL